MFGCGVSNGWVGRLYLRQAGDAGSEMELSAVEDEMYEQRYE